MRHRVIRLLRIVYQVGTGLNLMRLLLRHSFQEPHIDLILVKDVGLALGFALRRGAVTD